MRVVLHFFSFEEHEEYWFLAELCKAEKGVKKPSKINTGQRSLGGFQNCSLPNTHQIERGASNHSLWKRCLPMSYIGGPKGKVFHLSIESSILGSLHSFNFFLLWANQMAHLKKNWTCESPPNN
jgi:hypothetical protein